MSGYGAELDIADMPIVVPGNYCHEQYAAILFHFHYIIFDIVR